MEDFQGIFMDSSADFDRESGSIKLNFHALTFSNANRNIEIPFSNLELKVGGNNKDLIFFSDKHRPDITIYTSNKAILKADAFSKNPRFTEQIRKIKAQRSKIYGSLILILAIIVGLGFGIYALKDLFVEQLAKKVPIEWEQKMGDKLFETMTLQYDFIENDSLKQELIKVASPLMKQIEKDGTKIEFYFIKDPSINAFALPGGKVVIQTGLIEHANSWEEVLGVVSHELAHVTRRHHIRGVINEMGLYMIISGLVGDISAISGTVISMGGNLASLSNSRDFEIEADETGLEYLLAANVNPNGLVDFFKTLKRETSNKSHDELAFLSTHPATDDRIENLKKIIKTKKQAYKPITNDFKAFKERIKK